MRFAIIWVYLSPHIKFWILFWNPLLHFIASLTISDLSVAHGKNSKRPTFFYHHLYRPFSVILWLRLEGWDKQHFHVLSSYVCMNCILTSWPIHRISRTQILSHNIPAWFWVNGYSYFILLSVGYNTTLAIPCFQRIILKIVIFCSSFRFFKCLLRRGCCTLSV